MGTAGCMQHKVLGPELGEKSNQVKKLILVETHRIAIFVIQICVYSSIK